jgi:DEAD/DEAH box helicase domain-containing protein
MEDNQASELKVSKRKRSSAAAAENPPPKKGAPSSNGGDSNDPPLDIHPSSWAPEFRQLEEVFRSLNTVYTFCCTRKHFPTTFENLKSSVENLTRRYYRLTIILTRPLSVDDIVRIKALIPNSVSFEYVDEGQLGIDVETSEPKHNVKHREDIYMVKSEHSSHGSEVLFFEFTDGDLKPKVNRKQGYIFKSLYLRHQDDSRSKGA